MIRPAAKTIKLGHYAAKQIATGRSVANIALGIGCSRSRIYHALYTVFPNGDWCDIAPEIGPLIDPLLR